MTRVPQFSEFDFDALLKGTYVEAADVTRATGVHPAESNWPFALTALAARIEKETLIVTRVDHSRIRLMTDEEADDYLFSRTNRMVRGLVRTASRRARIDRTLMEPERRELAERRDRMSVAIAVAARQESRKQMLIERLVQSALPAPRDADDL